MSERRIPRRPWPKFPSSTAASQAAAAAAADNQETPTDLSGSFISNNATASTHTSALSSHASRGFCSTVIRRLFPFSLRSLPGAGMLSGSLLLGVVLFDEWMVLDERSDWQSAAKGTATLSQSVEELDALAVGNGKREVEEVKNAIIASLTTAWTKSSTKAAALLSSLTTNESGISATQPLPILTAPSPPLPTPSAGLLFNLIRYSFHIRLALCILWLLSVWMFGVCHARIRRKRRRARAERHSFPQGGVGGVRREVTWSSDVQSGRESTQLGPRMRRAAETAATDMAATLQATRPATRKRLVAFFSVAALVAMCAAALEIYLHFADSLLDLQSPFDSASASASRLLRDAESLLSWSMIRRGLLLTLWLALSVYLAVFAWYRKAVGTRKSSGRDKDARNRRMQRQSLHEEEVRLQQHIEDSDEGDDEYDSVYESEVEMEGGSISQSPERLQTDLMKDGYVVATVPLTALLPSSPSPPIESSSESSEESDLSDTESSTSNSVAATTLPVPSAAALLLSEKLDAALFYHPESELLMEQADFAQRELPSSTPASALNSPVKPTTSILSAICHLTHSPARLLSSSLPTAPSVLQTLYHLASTKFLSRLSRKDFDLLWPHCSWMHAAKGDDIVERGHVYGGNGLTPQSQSSPAKSAPFTTPTDGVLIVVSGVVGAVDPSNPSKILSRRHVGDCIGECEFVLPERPRVLTMLALTDVQLLRIPAFLATWWKSALQQRQVIDKDHEHVTGDSTSNDVPPATPSVSLFASQPSISSPEPSLSTDLLVSFMKTTLARQWRSANFLLHHFLQVPLNQTMVPPADARALSQSPSTDPTSTESSSIALSRSFCDAFIGFFSPSSPFFHSLSTRSTQFSTYHPSQVVFEEGAFCSDQLFVVLNGEVMLSAQGNNKETRKLGPGSVLNAIAFFAETTHTHTARVVTDAVTVAWLSRSDLVDAAAPVLRLAVLVCEVLAATLTQWEELGFERQWVRAGSLVFREGEACDALYIVASGRVRVLTGKLHKLPQKHKAGPRSAPAEGAAKSTEKPLHTSRHGHWLNSHPSGFDLSPFIESDSAYEHYLSSGSAARVQQGSVHGRVRFDLGAGELLGEISFLEAMRYANEQEENENAELNDGANFSEGGGSNANTNPLRSVRRSSSALCVRDAELIRVSRPCFERLIAAHPRVLLKISQLLAHRLQTTMRMGKANGAGGTASSGSRSGSVLASVPRSPFMPIFQASGGGSGSSRSCMSVCIVAPSALVARHDFALSLSMSLSTFGRTILLTPAHVDRVLGHGTCAHLHEYYTRAVFAHWMVHIESTYEFALLLADDAINPWTEQCHRSADLTLILAHAHDEEVKSDDSEDEEAERSKASIDSHSRHATLPSPARTRLGHRHARVSAFEAMLVWDERDRVVERQRRLQVRQKKMQQVMQDQEQRIAQEVHVRSPQHRNNTRPPTVFDVAFSPTLHPAQPVAAIDTANLPPLAPAVAATSTVPIDGSPVNVSVSPPAPAYVPLSSSSSAAPAYPRLHFSLRDLVLIHSSSVVLPRGTRFWLAARPQLHRYHHVAAGCQEHIDRLARYIAGKTVGLVLSGGGARGLAHMGTIQTFAEQGIPVDYVGGTSQGSFMAALYALQSHHHLSSLRTMAARVHAMASAMGSIRQLLTDATFPMLSYFSGQRFGENIAGILGQHTKIEDLWLPYFCVTTNISAADMCVHRSGTLWKAVRASMTVIEYLPPMQLHREWPAMLIDGGYTNNLPVDCMHGLFHPRFCIGVDVENKSNEEKMANVSYWGSGGLSGWWLMRNRLAGWAKASVLAWPVRSVKRLIFGAPTKPQENDELILPKFAELVGALLYINHNRNIRASIDNRLIDLYIQPNLGNTALLDYHRETEIIAACYQHTKIKLTEWRIRHSRQLPKATRYEQEDHQDEAKCSQTSSQSGADGGDVCVYDKKSSRSSGDDISVPSSLPTASPRLLPHPHSHSLARPSLLPPPSLTLTQRLQPSNNWTNSGSGSGGSSCATNSRRGSVTARQQEEEDNKGTQASTDTAATTTAPSSRPASPTSSSLAPLPTSSFPLSISHDDLVVTATKHLAQQQLLQQQQQQQVKAAADEGTSGVMRRNKSEGSLAEE